MEMNSWHQQLIRQCLKSLIVMTYYLHSTLGVKEKSGGGYLWYVSQVTIVSGRICLGWSVALAVGVSDR